MKFVSLLLSCVLFVLSACQKQNLRNAEESLAGTWNVTEIYSEQKNNLGINGDGRFWESGDLGVFTFSDNTVNYSYTRLDTLYESTQSWNLTREKEKQGFHKVEKYTLNINNQPFDCDFGDGTSDAEKNAERMMLSYVTSSSNPNYILTLVKQ